MNNNRKKMKADALFNQWRKERDKAVASLDVEQFEAFIKKWQALGAYDVKELPPRHILEISLHKMAVEITTIPAHIKQRATKWLLARGFAPFVAWKETETEGKNNDANFERSTDQ